MSVLMNFKASVGVLTGMNNTFDYLNIIPTEPSSDQLLEAQFKCAHVFEGICDSESRKTCAGLSHWYK